MITDEMVQEVKDSVNIVEYLDTHYLPLEASGNSFKAMCPFHINDDTPAFAVWEDSQRWRCFGECNDGGDLFDFIQKHDGVTFHQAIKSVIDNTGMDISTSMTEKEKREYRYKKKLLTVMEEATNFFHQQLMDTEEGRQALAYLKTYRGLKEDTIERFRIGYAPEGRDVVTHLANKGYAYKEMIDAGIAKSKNSYVYPLLRRRVIFPIIDTYGDVRAFGGRDLTENSKAKYLNTPNTRIFVKGNSIYGIYQAKKNARTKKGFIVVEGYMDVVVAHQEGFNNVVAVLGVSLTSEHADRLSSIAKDIYIAFDPDNAGDSAVIKSAMTVEQNSDSDVYIMSLPDDRDPDELILEEGGLFTKAIWQAKPLVIHLAGQLIEENSGRLDSPKVKRDIANQVLPLIERVKDPTEQAAYKEWLAKSLGFEKYKLTIVLPNGDRREVT